MYKKKDLHRATCSNRKPPGLQEALGVCCVRVAGTCCCLLTGRHQVYGLPPIKLSSEVLFSHCQGPNGKVTDRNQCAANKPLHYDTKWRAKPVAAVGNGDLKPRPLFSCRHDTHNTGNETTNGLGRAPITKRDRRRAFDPVLLPMQTPESTCTLWHVTASSCTFQQSVSLLLPKVCQANDSDTWWYQVTSTACGFICRIPVSRSSYQLETQTIIVENSPVPWSMDRTAGPVVPCSFQVYNSETFAYHRLSPAIILWMTIGVYFYSRHHERQYQVRQDQGVKSPDNLRTVWRLLRGCYDHSGVSTFL